MGGFDVIALRAICKKYVDEMIMPVLEDVQQSQAELRTQLLQLSSAVDEKAIASDVPTLDQFESFRAEVAQKASTADMEDILAKLQRKDSSDDRAMIEKLEERTARTERALRSHDTKISELRAFDQELQGKADSRDVPTLAQFKKLATTVEKKANANKVPTLEQFTELQVLAESKVSAHWVPSMQQFEALVAQVEQKANASNVISAPEFKSIQEEIQQKANITDIPQAAWIEEQLKKANTSQTTTQSSVDKLAAVIEKKLAFLASRVQKNTEALDQFQQPSQQQTMMFYVPAAACGTWGPANSDRQSDKLTGYDSQGVDHCGWSVQSQSELSASSGEALAPGGWLEPAPLDCH
jgi:hypothetical protein